MQSQPVAPRGSTRENKQILQLYVDRFYNRDWDGLRELVSADARLLVADRYSGSFAAGGYLGVYSRMKQTWQLTLGEVDREPSIILLNERNGAWEIEDSFGSISERKRRLSTSLITSIALGF